jgi:hypothetical protein
MKQTAVKWLYKLSNKRELDKFDLQQAIEMEKQQTLVDYSCGARDTILNIDFVDAVKYYNKTYGGKK